MKHGRWLIAKNAASNIVRGGATAIVAVALPHFMAHDLRPDRFSAWSLMLQIAAYASFLDIGLQATVARSVAQALELEQGVRARKLFGTAFALLSIAAVVALLLVAIVLLFAQSFFRGMPPGLLREFQIAAGVMTLGTALQLPFSAFSGVLVGMQRNDLPALAIGGSRLCGAAVAIEAARYTDSLVILAFCIVVPNLVGGLLQRSLVARLLPGSEVKRTSIDRTIAKELLRYCLGLSVWSFSMLLISGLDVAIVGHFDFAAVGAYAIASTVTSIQASANSSIMGAFLAPFAAAHAQGNFNQVRRTVVRATRMSAWFNALLLAATAGFGIPILRLWVSDYTAMTYPFLLTLMLSQTIRLCWTSYAVALMATNHQNECIFPAIVEGVVNIGVSVWAVQHYGAIGVAAGSVVGAVVTIPVLLIWTIYSRHDLPISRGDLVREGVARGLVSASPAILCALLLLYRPTPPGGSIALWTLALAASALLARKYVYPSSKSADIVLT